MAHNTVSCGFLQVRGHMSVNKIKMFPLVASAFTCITNLWLNLYLLTCTWILSPAGGRQWHKMNYPRARDVKYRETVVQQGGNTKRSSQERKTRRTLSTQAVGNRWAHGVKIPEEAQRATTKTITQTVTDCGGFISDTQKEPELPGVSHPQTHIWEKLWPSHLYFRGSERHLASQPWSSRSYRRTRWSGAKPGQVSRPYRHPAEGQQQDTSCSSSRPNLGAQQSITRTFTLVLSGYNNLRWTFSSETSSSSTSSPPSTLASNSTSSWWIFLSRLLMRTERLR